MDQALDDLREEIESIDCGLLRMWEKRMYAAVKTGVYKRDHGMSVYDAEREKQLWFNWQQQLDEDNADLAALLFQANTAAAKLRQSQICRNRQPNIYLIGMPGCGKKEAGREAARRLGRGFCDLDQLISAAYGRSIAEMLTEDGAETFRARETAILSALAAQPAGTIVATGDGVVLTPLNLSLMRTSGAMILVYRPAVDADVLKGEVCSERTDPELWLELWRQREPVYRTAAAATVTGENADEIAAQIVDLLE